MNLFITELLNRSVSLITQALIVLMLGNTLSAYAQDTLNATDSDPNLLQWMQGFPPDSQKLIRYTDPDFFSFPKLRWTVCNFRQLMPTVNVSRGISSPVPLERAIDDGIDAVTFTPMGTSETMTWQQSLAVNYTDGIVVLHKGRIVYERYFGCLDDSGVHAAMSVTKSFVGLLGEILVAEGVIDEHASVVSIIPEMKDSAFANATVRQVLDMTTGLSFSEDYANPNAEVYIYSSAGSPLPRPADYKGPRGYLEYLRTVKPQGQHGDQFAYKTINTEALGWIVSRVTGMSVAELLSQRIWRRMGAEQSGYMTVDSMGTPFAGGGFNAGLRDMARFGQLMLNKGEINGERLFPASVVDRIQQGGNKEAFAKAGYKTLSGGSYRGMWWVFHNKHGAFAARGVHGQTIYIDPTANMVIARFTSYPVAFNSVIDPTSLPAYQAVADYLLEK